VKVIGNALKVVRDFRRPYIAVNVGYYGLVLVTLLAAQAYSPLRQPVQRSIEQEVKEGTLAPVAKLYTHKHFLSAIAVTFAVNLLAGSLLVITVPSLIVPFSGVLLGAGRAVAWGLLFSPTAPGFTASKIAWAAILTVLIVLEGQGYILAMLASYIQGRLFLSPQQVGATSHWQGYKAGVGRCLRLYVLVAITLAVAAVYEATIGIYVAPHLR
jgi:hypothetical protein